jgi:predicted amidophosphoribosyltransferase
MLKKRNLRVDENGIYYYGLYHPYRVNGMLNPEFDREYSGMILALKNRERNWKSFFTKILSDQLEDNHNLVLMCVPSHQANTWGSCADVIDSLCATRNFINGSRFLRRIKTVEKNATGGSREIVKHLESIELDNSKISLLIGKDILIIDDVCTSGHSLKACDDIVVGEVWDCATSECFAFSKTKHGR